MAPYLHMNCLEKDNIPAGYKDSAVGIIPQEWEVKFFNDVCTFINGRAYKQEELLLQGKYPVLRVGNFFTNTNWYYSDIELDENKYANRGDLLYAWSASFGPRFWDGEKVIYHYHIWKIEVSNVIDKFFLYNYFELDARKLYNQIQGGTMAHITKGDMEQRHIPIPPIGEQRKIAEILGVWDEAIEKQSRLIEKLELRKRGLMQRLLTGRTRLPGFTTPWQKIKLGEICKRVTRRNEENCQNVMTISAQRGFVSQTDFFNKSVASSTLDNYYLVHKDEFCYNKSYSNGYPMGAIKRLKETEKAVVTTLYICFSIADCKRLDINFFEQYCEFGGLNRGLTKVANEGGRAHGLLNVTPSDFFGLQLLLPSLSEQKAIAEVLTVADNEIATHRKKLDALRQQKRGLMQQLLTGKTRIKI